MNATDPETTPNELREQFPNDRENMVIMMEESAEVLEQVNLALPRLIRMASKTLRFGIDDFHPKNVVPNRVALSEEIGQLRALFDILEARCVTDKLTVNEARVEKIRKMPKWYGWEHGKVKPGTKHCSAKPWKKPVVLNPIGVNNE